MINFNLTLANPTLFPFTPTSFTMSYKILIICLFAFLVCPSFNAKAQGLNPVAIDSLRLELQKYPPDDTMHCLEMIQLGSAYINLTPDSALAITNRALVIAKELNWKRGIASAYNQLGATYQMIGEYEKALRNFEAAENSGFTNNFFLASLELNKATIYAGIEDFPKAISGFSSAAQKFEAINEPEAALIGYTNVGTMYLKKGQFDSLYLNGLSIVSKAIKFKLPLYRAYGLTLVAAAHNNFKRFDSARIASWDAVKISKTLNDVRLESQALAALAETYAFEKNYDSAIHYAKRSLALVIPLNILENQAGMYQLLSDVYTAKGDWKDALKFQKQAISIKDSIISIDRKVQLNQQLNKLNFEKEKAINEITFRNQINRQKWIQGSLALFLIMVLLGGYLIFRQFKKRKVLEMDAQRTGMQLEQRVLENKVLRSQMNPHFIFNALGSISHFIRTHQSELADAYLARFASLMRMVLEQSKQEFVPLQDELEILRLYLDLEKQRVSHPFEFVFEIDENIDINETEIPPLLLQPFVENSIWHGVSHLKDQQGIITIRIGQNNEGMLKAEVEDNGNGRRNTFSSTSNQRKSIGLDLTAQRLAMLQLSFKQPSYFRLIDLEQGLCANITLPYAPIKIAS